MEILPYKCDFKLEDFNLSIALIDVRAEKELVQQWHLDRGDKRN